MHYNILVKVLFNDDWKFAEISLKTQTMFDNGNPVLFKPDDFYEEAQKQNYKAVTVPHDWMISNTKDLYRNSVGCYEKDFYLTEEQIKSRRNVIRFEGIYMNSGIWINGYKAGEWKYGYSTFEVDISGFVHAGKNKILVLAVYQNCNTRWYSGAGIFRDITFINSELTYLPTDGLYISSKPINDLRKWNTRISVEVAGPIDEHSLIIRIKAKDNSLLYESNLPIIPNQDKATVTVIKSFTAENPHLWDVEDPFYYIAEIGLLDKEKNTIDTITKHCGYKEALFDKDKGLYLNGRHIKIHGACHHHDLGALGSAFDVNALKRQFNILKEMGINSIRCSHNPTPEAFMDLCDEMGFLVDAEAFDMWEKSKTPFDYANYFNDWCQKDIAAWIRKDRNHPSLLMWSIGNEIYDTHMGNGFEITKKLYKYVRDNDSECVAPITIASNYMMTEGAQHCATQIDLVGYNYLERLYKEHHEKHPEWKIYGSETSSTVQSRGIYHFPESLKLVTFSDGQCSSLGNCTTTWGAANTQTVIANDRDCPFSIGQYIWTGWDYIGEPTPYHSKNSFFGQIDTAGFPKDTYYLYKSEWAYKKAPPFVHLLPYWDWNEGQIIDVKAYSNTEAIELFFNGTSLGLQKINHVDGKEPFGYWQVPYHKGTLTAVGYDENGRETARDTKASFEDPSQIILEPETNDTDNLFFIDIMTADKNNIPVENARNYITVNVTGNAELVGMDNGDSTDFDEYKSKDGKTHTRRLFSNRLVAIIRTENADEAFTVTAASRDLPEVSISHDKNKWNKTTAARRIEAENDFIPSRKIEIKCSGSTRLTKDNREIKITAKVLPENATNKEINWNPVLKECVSSDNITVNDIQGKGTGTESAVIKAVSDGECILRCTAKNGTVYDEVISDLPFTIEGIGNPRLNPYKLIEACRFNDWDKNTQKPTVSLESGISNRFIGPLWISFDKVDFGKDGADTIHIPIFSFDKELPIEIWDGKPADGTTREKGAKPSKEGIKLGTFTYRHESIYNTYSENIFTLKKRLFGIHTISVVLPYELVFHGFYFDRTLKALSKLNALDASSITGDSFTKTEEAVEGIGNNVNLDFSDMNFGENKATKLTICGKSNTPNNTINLKFFDKEGNVRTDVIEFAHTKDYEEKTFELSPVTGEQTVSFVFLPGSNFDFKWFKFTQ